jgi:hypothetical protein
MIEPYELEEARAVTAAVRTLKEHLTCGDSRVEVQAARSILKLSHAYTQKQLLRRVAQLEQAVRERSGLRPSLC